MARTGAMMQSPVVVVIGAEAARMRAEVAGLDIQVVENPRWSDGLSTSVRTGLAALESAGSFDAAVFTTCDQPGITPDLLREMIRTYAASRPPIVACAYGGTVGVPALYDRSLFVELRELRGDAGAKRVIERHRSHVVTVPFPEAAPDVDTTDDVKGLAD
jgi:molybdenum cofactor cytidylyltransferase